VRGHNAKFCDFGIRAVCLKTGGGSHRPKGDGVPTGNRYPVECQFP
jgi:hypothetical protein